MINPFDAQTFWYNLDHYPALFWPVIVLDFNGVFDQYKGWNGQIEDYPPREGIEYFLDALEDYFRTIVVVSATMPIESVINWLIKHHLDPYIDYVTNHKVPATVYVDDKAVTFKGNFEETLNTIRVFKPYWETVDTGR